MLPALMVIAELATLEAKRMMTVPDAVGVIVPSMIHMFPVVSDADDADELNVLRALM